METINQTTYNEGIQTTIKIDNGTNFKDCQIDQGIIDKAESLTIQVDKMDDCITIGNINLTGINKDLFLQFINQ